MKMNLVVFSSLALLLQTGDDGRLDAAQFAKILVGLHAPIRDVEMIVEGEYRALNETDPDHLAKALKTDMIFQGNYAYRADGRVYFDSYEKLIANNLSMSRRTYALVNGQFETRNIGGSYRKQPAMTQRDYGSSGSIDNKPGSPGRFCFLDFWREFLAEHPDLTGYRYEGWEQVDGHECLKITLEQSPGGEQVSKFWIDMKRGGHVLRQDFIMEDVLWYRKHQIELAQFQLPDGATIWFPIRGVFDTFLNAKGPTEKPVIHEFVGIVQGTLLFNQGLPDDRFSIDWDGKKVSSAGYSNFQKNFSEIPAKAVKPALKRDAASVRKYQEEKLAELARNAEALDASPPSRRSWNGVTASQAALTAVGIVALLLALRVMYRPR